MSGHDLAREPGLGEQSDHRLGEMPLTVRPMQPLNGAKRSRDEPGPSHSADSPTAAPPPKKVRMIKSKSRLQRPLRPWIRRRRTGISCMPSSRNTKRWPDIEMNGRRSVMN